MTVLPVIMFLRNLGLFCWHEQESGDDSAIENVSILIPARDEADSIEMSVRAALQSRNVNVEVIVLDDDSTDDTHAIVRTIAEKDDRVKLISGTKLPDGWNGKQFACKQLAESASHDVLVFIDADVRLAPQAITRLVSRMRSTSVGLLSAFPRQITRTWLESWMIPMMHFILLGYLPFDRMRESNDASFAAGCGQLFVTTRDAYERAGTHEAIANSRHDGVKLPRAYRENGLMTDAVDGTELADCRMYQGASAVVRGILKNATEGIANARLIGIFTVLLLGCSLFPVMALVIAIVTQHITAIFVSGCAVLICHLPRLIAVKRFRQSMLGALCHVPATTGFVVLQWIALFNQMTGRKIAWRGRADS